MAASITGRFLITASNLIQAPITPEQAAAGVQQGKTIGVVVSAQPIDAPQQPMPLQWPFYQEGAGEYLTVGSTIQVAVTRVADQAASS